MKSSFVVTSLLICFDMRIDLISALDLSSIPVLGSVFNNKTYDYIVVGAGTAGMTIGKCSQQFPRCQGE
jgi:hypothetical protein